MKAYVVEIEAAESPLCTIDRRLAEERFVKAVNDFSGEERFPNGRADFAAAVAFVKQEGTYYRVGVAFHEVELETGALPMTVWSPEDIQQFRPEWAPEQCLKFLTDNLDKIVSLQDELKWEAMGSFLTNTALVEADQAAQKAKETTDSQPTWFLLQANMDTAKLASEVYTEGYYVVLSAHGDPAYQDPSQPICDPHVIPVDTFAEASKECRKYIESNELGNRQWVGGQVYQGGKLVAQVSYSGCVRDTDGQEILDTDDHCGLGPR